MSVVGFFTLFLAASAEGEIEKYLKICEDKQSHHKIENIDFIYMINLDKRPAKFARSCLQLNQYNIFPYRFSAVNGWEIPIEQLSDLGVVFDQSMPKDLWGTYYKEENQGEPTHEVMSVEGRSYFCHCMTRGAIGIVLSHMSVLKDALDSGYNTIWVMEDDIEVIQNPNLISKRIEQLDSKVGSNNWDVLFTDRDTKSRSGEYVECKSYAIRPNFTPLNSKIFSFRKSAGKHFFQTGARYGAYSMIIRRSGIEKIYNFISRNKVFLPYDMEFYLPDNINLFCVKEDIVSTQIDASSDNGAPNYRKNL